MICCFILHCLLAICYQSKSQITIADSLYSKSLYTDALVEYKFCLYQSKDSSTILHAKYQQALCYKHLQLFGQAIDILNDFNPMELSDSMNFLIKYHLIHNYLLEKSWENALLQCNQAKIIISDTQLLSLLVPFEIIAQTEQMNWDGALNNLQQYCNNNNNSINTDSIRKAIAATRFSDVKKAKRLSYFFPGLGQLYVGKEKHALTSMLLQSGFLIFTVYSLYHAYYFSAVLTGVGNWRTFYIGGAEHAAYLARQQNELKIKNIKNLIFNKLQSCTP